MRNTGSRSFDPTDFEWRKQELAQWLRDAIARLINAAPDTISSTAPFSELGLNSLMMVRIAGELEELLDVELHPTVAYEYSTIEALCAYLAEQSSSR
jgi:acyl carrier protein